MSGQIQFGKILLVEAEYPVESVFFSNIRYYNVSYSFGELNLRHFFELVRSGGWNQLFIRCGMARSEDIGLSAAERPGVSWIPWPGFIFAVCEGLRRRNKVEAVAKKSTFAKVLSGLIGVTPPLVSLSFCALPQ